MKGHKMRCEIDRANDTTLDNALWQPQHRCPLLIGTKAVPPIEPHWFKERLAALKMSQRQLAIRLSLDHAAVSLMLRGKRQMSMDEAKQLADILLVPVTEVMRRAGIEVLDDVRKVPIAGYIGTAGTVTLLPQGTHDAITAPADVPTGSFALQLRQVASPKDGWIYFVSGSQQQPLELLDRLCLMALKDGGLVIAICRRGYKTSLYNLVMTDSTTVLENREVVWAAKVLWIQPT